MARRGYPRLPDVSALSLARQGADHAPDPAPVGDFYTLQPAEAFELNKDGNREGLTTKIFQAGKETPSREATFRLPFANPVMQNGVPTLKYGYRVYEAYPLWQWLKSSDNNRDPADNTLVTEADFNALRDMYEPNYVDPAYYNRRFRNMPAGWSYVDFAPAPLSPAEVEKLKQDLNETMAELEQLQEQYDALRYGGGGNTAAMQARIDRLAADLRVAEQARDRYLNERNRLENDLAYEMGLRRLAEDDYRVAQDDYRAAQALVDNMRAMAVANDIDPDTMRPTNDPPAPPSRAWARRGLM